MTGVGPKVRISKDSEYQEVEGCYEGLTCSNLQRILALLEELDTWKAACIANNCSAGRFLSITGDESKMTIMPHSVGPFC